MTLQLSNSPTHHLSIIGIMRPVTVLAVLLAVAAGVFVAGQNRSVFQARQEEPRLVPAPLSSNALTGGRASRVA